MGVKITCIKKDVVNPEGNKYLGIKAFRWIDETTQKTGEASREIMYDWIVNQRGQAYVITKDGVTILVFGAISPLGNKYIRTVHENKWTDELLDLPECT